MSFEFRLATLCDDLKENIEEIYLNAKEYVDRSNDKSLKPIEIVQKFQQFVRGELNDPQYWIALNEKTPVGYMLTTFVEINGHYGLQMWQGYLRPEYQVNGNADFCIKTVEDFAKEGGAEFVSCITKLNPKSYERWIKQKGYKMDYTCFMKEVA